jgi:hypothetical protein
MCTLDHFSQRAIRPAACICQHTAQQLLAARERFRDSWSAKYIARQLPPLLGREDRCGRGASERDLWLLYAYQRSDQRVRPPPEETHYLQPWLSNGAAAAKAANSTSDELRATTPQPHTTCCCRPRNRRICSFHCLCLSPTMRGRATTTSGSPDMPPFPECVVGSQQQLYVKHVAAFCALASLQAAHTVGGPQYGNTQ